MILTCLMTAMLVHDGDSLICQRQRIRLTGVDAPELAQVCEDTPCGIISRDALRRLLNGKQVTCIISGTDKYGRSLGDCWLDMLDINTWLVVNGYAVTYYGDQYKAQMLDAMQHQRGIWRYRFELPSEWRRERR